MNAFFTTVVLALALFASCEALGLKDAVFRCDDDEGISAADKALLLTNKPELVAANAAVKSWLSCYYMEVGVLPRGNDNETSESLSRKAFVLSYPSLWLSGNSALLKCNEQVKSFGTAIANIDEKAYAYHKCVVTAGFKL